MTKSSLEIAPSLNDAELDDLRKEEIMRIGIVGAGPIGKTLARKLSATSFAIFLSELV
jgi:lactate dehydrogenase-like 2-hydroxyacid dehydrogenase